MSTYKGNRVTMYHYDTCLFSCKRFCVRTVIFYILVIWDSEFSLVLSVDLTSQLLLLKFYL